MLSDLVRRLDRHLCVAIRAMRHAGSGKQDPHIVLDIGHRADRRAWVAADTLLLDRDYWRESVHKVDIRLLDLLDTPARIGRERLQKAALALGIDRLKRQRRLARARKPGNHHQLLARNFD